jgi:hypothetical protein
MENDSLASAIREIPFRQMALDREYDENQFIKIIYSVNYVF